MFSFTVNESVTIERPMEEVFDYIAEGENDVEWCPSVERIERISGNGPGPGVRYRMHHTPGGMDFDAKIEVVAYERPRVLKWVMTDSGHTIRGTYELEAVNGHTRLTQTSQITFEGWLRIPGLFMKGRIAGEVEEELRKQFANLKRVLESESNTASSERPQPQPGA